MIPVILSGGSGTRLWPVSRDSYPKQFCEFFDRSFLRNSIERVREYGTPWVVTLTSMQGLANRTLTESGFDAKTIIAEPMARNTAPAIALLCHVLKIQGLENEVVGIFPADHFIGKPEVLKAAMELASQEAHKKKIVTLGISPSYPATGYGYIELDSHPSSLEKLSPYLVRAFIEKPQKGRAEKMMEDDRFFWNAGLFFFRVDHMIELMNMHLPKVWSKISEIKSDFSNAAYVYSNIESISFDYGIMEKTKDILCIPCDPAWSDVGSWDEVARLSDEVPTDSHAQIILNQAENNFVYSTRQKVVALANVDDLIVVNTPDALLITRKGESQQVKALVEQMRIEGVSETIEHAFTVTNWGRIETLDEGVDFEVSKLIFDKNSRGELSRGTYLVIDGEIEIHNKKYGINSLIILEKTEPVANSLLSKATVIEVQSKRV